MDQEIPLNGGSWTAGVVRVGDTVRRPASASSGFTATFLSHLAAQGFAGAPRHLGWDEKGRDVLTFIPGDVLPKWRRRTDEQIAAAAVILRQMHDASRGLAGALGGGEVVCHHDPSQTNMVFRQGIPVVHLGKPERGPAAEQARQVRLLADAYELSTEQRRRLPAAIDARLVRNEHLWQQVLDDEQSHITPARAAEVLEWTRQEAAFVTAHRRVFEAALS